MKLRFAAASAVFAVFMLLVVLPTSVFAEFGAQWVDCHDLDAGACFNGVASNGSRVVLVGNNGFIQYSDNEGDTWITRSSGSIHYYDVTYGGGLFVAVGKSGLIKTSPDGHTWTTRSSGVTGYLKGVAHNGTNFVAVGTSDTILYSANGITWTAGTSGSGASLDGICTTENGTFIVAGSSGWILRSTNNGVSWSKQRKTNGGVYYNLYAAAYGNGICIVGGQNGRFFRSTNDGATWSEKSNSYSNYFLGAAYVNGKFIAATNYVSGNPGTPILVSSDGNSWTGTYTTTTRNLYAVGFSSSYAYVAGHQARAFRSQDSFYSVELKTPVDGTPISATSVTLSAKMTNLSGGSVDVTFLGRPVSDAFVMAVFPDSQWYPTEIPEAFDEQTEWAVENNAVFAAHVGDIVEYGESCSAGDNSYPQEWPRAKQSLEILENPTTTGLTDGIPYLLAIGNHDRGVHKVRSDETTTCFNTYLGTNHFGSKAYYNPLVGSPDLSQPEGNNDNAYVLFDHGNFHFVAISLGFREYNDISDDVYSWAGRVLNYYSNRRAIIVSHDILDPTGELSDRGQTIFDHLKGYGNIFLMLSGHHEGTQKYKTLTGTQNNSIHAVTSCFHLNSYDGGGFMRILVFVPSRNKVYVKSYSPSAGSKPWINDSDNSFSFTYNMGGNENDSSGLSVLGTVTGVTNGQTVSFNWNGLSPTTTYEWTVRVIGAADTYTVTPFSRFFLFQD